MIEIEERKLAVALKDIGGMYEILEKISKAAGYLDEVIDHLDDERSVEIVNMTKTLIQLSSSVCIRTLSIVEEELYSEGVDHLDDYLPDESDEESIFNYDEDEEYEYDEEEIYDEDEYDLLLEDDKLKDE